LWQNILDLKDRIQESDEFENIDQEFEKLEELTRRNTNARHNLLSVQFELQKLNLKKGKMN
jgi:hypothetical protein